MTSDRSRAARLGSAAGIRVSTLLLGISRLACGQSEFHYATAAAPFIPCWIPAHAFCAALISAQMMAFTVLIGLVEVRASPQRFHCTGLLISWQISAPAGVVAQTYHPARVPGRTALS